mmetsp:Transcript_1295/g.1673  ORF Transcript_1295/g.1673 Transcript_1295/m.1673 type:complete len:214 (+) Transcript_1295:2905-3546(+)
MIPQEKYSLIVLEIVATRDIEVDEEVFIDYGIEWEEAWNVHIRDWRSPCDNSHVLSSKAIRLMNDDKFNSEFHAWSRSHYTVCTIDGQNADLVHLLKDGDGPLYSEEQSLFEYHGIKWDHSGFNYLGPDSASNRKPCLIFSASKENDTFEVVIFYGSTESPSRRILQLQQNISAEAIEFIDLPFRSDMHRKEAFRHPIYIPDEIFPRQWKDLL